MIKIATRSEPKRDTQADAIPKVLIDLASAVAQTQKSLTALVTEKAVKKVMIATIERDPTTDRMTRVIITIQ